MPQAIGSPIDPQGRPLISISTKRLSAVLLYSTIATPSKPISLISRTPSETKEVSNGMDFLALLADPRGSTSLILSHWKGKNTFPPATKQENPTPTPGTNS